MSSSPKVGFVSLGCPKALSDSEQILTQLRAEGYQTSKTYENADLVIVNTCGFIDAAVQESLDAIGEALHANGKVIVTGCLGAKKTESGDTLVQSVHPKVLAVTGPHATAEVMSAVHQAFPRPHEPFVDLIPPQGVRLTPKHYAYLKISEGCNHRCTFCIIPSMRGDLDSRPIHEVLQEAENLAKAGVKELLVISQDTSAYGVDVKSKTGFYQGRTVKTRLTELCSELVQMGMWVRLHYVYPYPHVDELIGMMTQEHASGGRLLPYLDVPLQHASPRILKLMKRPANMEKTLDRIQQWRAVCPDITIRSTFIAGFPGETETEFQELLQFLTEAQLDRVGCFAYSDVDGAVANSLPDPVDEAIKQARVAQFMQHQTLISQQKLRKKVGTIQKCIVDEVTTEYGIARSMADAPEIDGRVYITLPDKQWKRFKVGDMVRVKIERSDEHDLWGRL